VDPLLYSLVLRVLLPNRSNGRGESPESRSKKMRAYGPLIKQISQSLTSARYEGLHEARLCGGRLELSQLFQNFSNGRLLAT